MFTNLELSNLLVSNANSIFLLLNDQKNINEKISKSSGDFTFDIKLSKSKDRAGLRIDIRPKSQDPAIIHDTLVTVRMSVKKYGDNPKFLTAIDCDPNRISYIEERIESLGSAFEELDTVLLFKRIIPRHTEVSSILLGVFKKLGLKRSFKAQPLLPRDLKVYVHKDKDSGKHDPNYPRYKYYIPFVNSNWLIVDNSGDETPIVSMSKDPLHYYDPDMPGDILESKDNHFIVKDLSEFEAWLLKIMSDNLESVKTECAMKSSINVFDLEAASHVYVSTPLINNDTDDRRRKILFELTEILGETKAKWITRHDTDYGLN